MICDLQRDTPFLSQFVAGGRRLQIPALAKSPTQAKCP
jgi:hypothetical protein